MFVGFRGFSWALIPPKKDDLNLTHYLLIGAVERSLEGFLNVF